MKTSRKLREIQIAQLSTQLNVSDEIAWRVWEAHYAVGRGTNWPGQPLTQVPLDSLTTLDEGIKLGLLKIVDRPGITNPARTVSYVVAVD